MSDKKKREPSPVSTDMKAIRAVGEARAKLNKAHAIRDRNNAEDSQRIHDAEGALIVAQEAAVEAQRRLGLSQVVGGEPTP